MAEWTAERMVSPALATRLVRTQFPALGAGDVVLLGEGWDNTVYRVDTAWAFRFPRRQLAVPGVVTEMAVMPELARALPLAVPAPVFHGVPDDEFPWPFFGCALLGGREACEAQLGDDGRRRLARDLGRFLRALHDPAHVATFGPRLRVDPMGRADMAQRVPRTRARIDDVVQRGLWTPPAAVHALLQAAEALPPPPPSVVMHGDLHFRHLMVDDAGALSGVIDWGDVNLGDPSVDLHLLYDFLDEPAREELFAVYGPISDHVRLRAQVLALFISAALASYGHAEGMEHVLREAVAGLERAARSLSAR